MYLSKLVSRAFQKTILTLLCLALLCTGVKAGINEWTSLLPPGIDPEDLVLDPSHENQMYCFAESNGATIPMKTVDEGMTWKTINNGLPLDTITPYSLAGTYSEPFILYISCKVRPSGGGDYIALYESSDRGGIWQEIVHALGIS